MPAADTQKDTRQESPISVLGAGSWGTALALQLSNNGHAVTLWGRDAELLEKMAQTRCNSVYLPGCELPHHLHVQNDLTAAVNSCRILIIAVPSTTVRALTTAIADELSARQQGILLATKGIETSTAQLMHEVLEETLGPDMRLAYLSGPSFADEVARQLPTAVTISCSDRAFAEQTAALFDNSSLRVYTSGDVIGTEIAGAFKNVIAIAAGISDGLGFGANTRAALITRGLSEIRRLAQAMGAAEDTLYGLAGIGDLVLTCTGDQSRNRRLGLLLAEGDNAEEAGKKIGQATEGVPSARATRKLAQRYGVEMPICEQVNRIIAGKIAPQDAVRELLNRPLKSED